jgi:hypothetical protein
MDKHPNTPMREREQTAQPPIVPAVVNGTNHISPEFIRLPKAGSRCPITGLSRTSLVELVDKGAVKAVKLRKRGSLRGITLLVRESLLGYLHGLAMEGGVK